MIESDEGGDAGGDECINEVGIEFDAKGVYGVITPTERDNSRPREGEAVGFDAVLL
jgi:hypothetical protein